MMRNKKTLIAFVWAAVSIIFGVGLSFFIQKAGLALAPFVYFLFLSTAISFLPPFWILVAVQYKFYPKAVIVDNSENVKVIQAGGDDVQSRSLRRKLFGQMRQLPLFVLGLLSALNGVMVLYANPHVPAISQALLGPGVTAIPLVMLGSVIWLGARYGRLHLFAILVILYGLACVMTSSVEQTLKQEASDSDSKSSSNVIWWDLMFALSAVPAAAASVYQEAVLRRTGAISMSVLIASMTTYQTLSIVLLAPVSLIPGFSRTSSFSDLWTNFSNGFDCFRGVDVDCKTLYGVECQCDVAWIYTCLFSICYVVSNFSSLAVLKYGNATIAAVIGSAITPATFLAFSIRSLNPDASAPNIWDAIALVAIVGGAVLFRFADLKGKRIDADEDDVDAQLPWQISNVGIYPIVHVESRDSMRNRVKREYQTLADLPSLSAPLLTNNNQNNPFSTF